MTAVPRATFVPALQLSLRAASAAALAVLAAELLGLRHPIYALIGAVIVIDLSAKQTRQLAVRRLIGSTLGAAIGAVLAALLPQSVWAIGLGVLLAMLASHLLRLEPAAKLAGYVCGIVLLGHHDSPWAYAVQRLLETVVGIGAALAVSFVPKLLDSGERT